jgi:methionine-S-sulfoxide reductase
MLEMATLAAGCFWGVEAVFAQVDGVVSTTVGYTGGSVERPSYEQVCTGLTGHAEAVRIEFDPEVVSYGELLDIFWENHDPTTPNRQGPDIGDQYRSAVFFHSLDQERVARATRDSLDASGRYTDPIVTEIVPATDFYPAEEYHQDYYRKHGLVGCGI